MEMYALIKFNRPIGKDRKLKALFMYNDDGIAL